MELRSAICHRDIASETENRCRRVPAHAALHFDPTLSCPVDTARREAAAASPERRSVRSHTTISKCNQCKTHGHVQVCPLIFVSELAVDVPHRMQLAC